MKKLLILLFPILILFNLGGCTSSSKAIKGPDGKEGYVIRCGLGYPEQCYVTAAKNCPKGYEEISFNPGNLQDPIPHILIVNCNK